ncbi:MAG: hypothetical protein AMJ90_08885 [candidate division Zixibacteria bacterium SM23_73_2]|nr:MAG: hypothetical protein AMJ90_08885 [candidate division Zixibacteria bacterium SM23_73_2]
MPKKIAYIIFNNALEPEVLDLLKKVGVAAYTRWDRVKGVGKTGPHMGDEVWPAWNTMIMSALEVEKKEALSQEIKKLRNNFPEQGIRMLVLPLEEIV